MFTSELSSDPEDCLVGAMLYLDVLSVGDGFSRQMPEDGRRRLTSKRGQPWS